MCVIILLHLSDTTGATTRCVSCVVRSLDYLPLNTIVLLAKCGWEPDHVLR